MATAADNQPFFHRLCEIFPQVEPRVIQMVAEDCKFDMHEACRVLFDMNEENKGNKKPADEACVRIVDFIKKGYKVMVLMRGLPGSGKTSLAITLLTDGLGSVNRDEFVLSTDDYFNKSGRYVFNPNELHEAHLWNQRRAFANAKRGVSPIIIDNTNLEIWEMKVYCTMGVQFGYIIELVEVSTAWALKPNMLAGKNNHGVDKQKIKAMLDKYQQGVTLRGLMNKFKLTYTVKLPQSREYPPFSVPFQQPKLPDVANGAKKKQTPVEYVHKFQNRRKSKGETFRKTDVDRLLDIDKSTENKNENFDLISFINELKPTPKAEEVVQSGQAQLLAKQLEEQKEMISKLMTLVSEKKLPSPPIDVAVAADDKMEVDQPDADLQIPEPTSQSKGLDALLEENKKLQDLLGLAQNSSAIKQSNPFASLVKPTSEKDVLKSNRLQMFFDSMKATDDAPSQPKKPLPPNLDRKAWGLTEDALVSWEHISSPTYEFVPRGEDATSVEVCEQSTNTAAEDTRDTLQIAPGIFLAQSYSKRTTAIPQQRKLDKSSPPKRMMLDKGCMTDEAELLLKITMDEKAQMKELMELFPEVPPECILDVYEKCQKDFHWTADVISSSPSIYTTTSVTEQQEKSAHGDSDGFQEVENRKKNLTEESQTEDEEKFVPKQTIAKQESTTKPESTTDALSKLELTVIKSWIDLPVNLSSPILQPSNKNTDNSHRNKNDNLPPTCVKQRQHDILQKTQMRQHNSSLQMNVHIEPMQLQSDMGSDTLLAIEIESDGKSMNQFHSPGENNSPNTEKGGDSSGTLQSSPSFSLNDWTVIQPQSSNSQDVDEEDATKQKQKQEEEKSQLEKQEEEAKQEEEVKQLKEQIEKAKQLKEQEEQVKMLEFQKKFLELNKLLKNKEEEVKQLQKQEEEAKQLKKQEEEAKQLKKQEEEAKQLKEQIEKAKQLKEQEEQTKMLEFEDEFLELNKLLMNKEEEAKQLQEQEEEAKQLQKQEEVAKQLQKQEEEAKLLKKQEEEANELRKQEEEAKMLKKQELLVLKKQLEESVTIGKEHYSEHVWQIKNSKSEPSASNIPNQQADCGAGVIDKRSETPDLMTLTDDTIYVSDDSSDEDNESVEEDMVELTLGEHLVEQLENMFGQLSLGDHLKPTVQIPESLARQLHGAYLESLCRQIENQSEYISRQMKEDEDFAMKLQEAERQSVYGNSMGEIIDEELALNLYKKDVEQWKDMTPDTLAQKLTKQKLYAAFPAIDKKLLDELLAAHENDYRQTVETIMASGNSEKTALGSGENVMEPPVSESTLKEMKMQARAVTMTTGDEDIEETDGKAKSAREYREEANAHMQKREELQRLVQNYYQKRAYAISMFYAELAQKELKKADLANQHAVQCFVQENCGKFKDSETLDLHFLHADAALNSLDIFIDYQISELKKRNKNHESYSVITGWGKRSKNGRPVLKPVVMRRLKQRNIQFTVVNPGMLKIKIHKNLLMTTDIRKRATK